MTSTPETIRSEGAARPARRGRRVVRRLAWAALAGVVLMLGAYALRGVLITPWLLAFARDAVAERTGAELQVEQLGGSWLFDLRLEGVAWSAGREDDPLRELAAREITLAYSPWRLLRGDLGGLQHVRVQGLSALVDLTRVEPGSDTEPDTGAGLQLPAALPELDLTGERVEVVWAPGARAAARGLSIRNDADGALVLSAQEARVIDPSVGERAGPLRLSAVYADGLVSQGELDLGGEPLVREARVDLTGLGAGALAFGLSLEASGGTTRLEGDLAPGTLALRWTVEGLDLARLERTLVPAAAPREVVLTGIVASEGQVELALGAPLLAAGDALRGSVTLTGSDLAYGAQAAEHVSVRATVAPGQGGPVLEIHELAVDSGANHLVGRALSGPLSPIIDASAREPAELLRALRGQLELDLGDLVGLFGPLIAEQGERAGDPVTLPPGRLAINVRLDATGAELFDGRFESAGGSLTLDTGRVDWAPELTDSTLSLNLTTRFHDLASVVAPFVGESTGAWAGSVAGTLRVHGSAVEPTGVFDLRCTDMVLAGRPIGQLAVLATAYGGDVGVESLLAQGDYGRIEARGGMNLASGELADVELTADLTSLERAVAAFVSPTAAEPVGGGNVHVSAELAGRWSRPTGSISVVGSELDLAGRRFEVLTTELAARPDALVVQSLVARLAPTDPDGDGLELDAAGEVVLDPGRVTAVELARARLALGPAVLALREPARLELGPESMSLAAIALEDGRGGALEASFVQDADGLTLTVSPRRLDPGPFVQPWLPAGVSLPEADSLDGELLLASYPEGLEVDVDVALLGLRWPDGPTVASEATFDLRLAGRLEQARLALESLSLTSDAGHRLLLSGTAPFDPESRELWPDGEIDLRGELALPFEAGIGDLSLGGAEQARAVPEVLQAKVDVSGDWGALAVNATLDGASSGATFQGRATLADGRLRLEPLRLDLPRRLDLEVKGDAIVAADGRCDARRWFAGEWPGLEAVPLDMRVRLAAPDLSFAAGVFSGLRRLEAAVDADVLVRGSLALPELTGEATVDGLDLRLLEGGRAFEDCRGRLVFAGRRVEVVQLSGAYGAGPFQASGWIDLGPEDPGLDLRVVGQEILLARSAGMRLRGDCELHIVGPPTGLLVEGEVALREGLFTRNFDLFGGLGGGSSPPSGGGRGIPLFSFREEPLASTQFDVRLVAADPFVIRNNVVRGAVRPNLRLMGTGRVPGLVGAVFVDDGRVSLPATRLYITSGTLTFTREDPLVPSIELIGESRIQGFDIRMHASGPYENALVEFTSVPPLNEEDLRVLVLTGQTPAQALTRSGSTKAATSVATFLGRDLISAWFGDPDNLDESFMDRFDVEAGSEVSRAGVEAYSASFRLTNTVRRIDGPGREIHLVGEQTVQRRINFGLRFLFRLK